MSRNRKQKRLFQQSPSVAIRAKFQQIPTLYQQGRLIEAEHICEEVLQHQPRHFDVLHLLGVIALQTYRTQRGVELIKKAITLNPNIAEAYSNLGAGLKDLKRFDEALASYDKAIALKPTYAEAYYNRGITLTHLKRFKDALASYDKAIELKPNYPSAYNNRGNVLSDLDRFEEALPNFDRAIELQPNYVEAYNNRGTILSLLRRYFEALESCEKAIALMPDNAEAHNNRGNNLCKLERYDESFAAYDKALALKPDLAEAWLGRGNVFAELKHYDEAFSAYDKALVFRPDLAEAWLCRGNVFRDLKRYDEAFAAYDKSIALKPELAKAWLYRGRTQMSRGKHDEGRKDFEQALALGANKDIVAFELARFGIAKAPTVVPQSIVVDLFDSIAGRFDQHLVHQLKYHVPANLFNLMRQSNQPTSVDILDLGCGTGLTGIQVRSSAKRLVGVDVSQKMLAIAKSRAIYDDLICEEIIEFLNSHKQKYDVVISTDVFIYFGDLAPIFILVHRTLNDNGYFCFSAESTNDGDDYRLRETGRYQHSKGYLERLASGFGFMVQAIEETIIRQESNTGVPGFLAIMRRL